MRSVFFLWHLEEVIERPNHNAKIRKIFHLPLGCNRLIVSEEQKACDATYYDE